MKTPNYSALHATRKNAPRGDTGIEGTNRFSLVQLDGNEKTECLRNDHRIRNQRFSEAFFMALSIVNPKGLSATISSGDSPHPFDTSCAAPKLQSGRA
jgi:hypothetical protein